MAEIRVTQVRGKWQRHYTAGKKSVDGITGNRVRRLKTTPVWKLQGKVSK